MKTVKLSAALLLAAVMVLVFVARSGGKPEAPPGAAPAAATASVEPRQVPVPPAVERAVEEARDGFVADGDSWVGAPGALGARVDASGLEVWPGNAGVRLATAAIVRDGRQVASERARVSGEAQAVALDRGTVIERFASREQGIEQTWTFGARPEGRGDLVVEVAVEGGSYERSSDAGVHLRASDEAGLVYGVATWVDADGRKMPVAQEYRDGRIVMVVAEAALEASKYPAVLDPIISAETFVGTQVQFGASANDVDPAAAWNGTHYLVVWAESNRVYGVRMRPDGTVVGGLVFPISPSGVTAAEPTVASNGDGFFVAWLQTSGTDTQIKGARVNASGTVLDTTPVSVSTGTSTERKAPRMAWSGARWSLVWEQGGTIYANWVANNSPGTPVVVATKPLGSSDYAPAIDCASGYCTITWTRYRQTPTPAGYLIYARVWQPVNSLLLGSPTAVTTTAVPTGGATDIAYSPSFKADADYVVAWGQKNSLGVIATMAATLSTTTTGTITATLATVASAGMDVESGETLIRRPSVAIANDGSNKAVVSYRHYVAGISPLPGTWSIRNTVLGGPTMTLRSSVYERYPRFALLANGQELVHVHAVNSSLAGTTTVWGRRLQLSCSQFSLPCSLANTTLTVRDSSAIPVTRPYSNQSEVAVGFSTRLFPALVAFTDDNDGSGIEKLYVTVYDQLTGTVGTPRAVATSVREQSKPAVAYNGDDYLVAWREPSTTTSCLGSYAVRAARVTYSGTPFAENLLVKDCVAAVDRIAVASLGSSSAGANWAIAFGSSTGLFISWLGNNGGYVPLVTTTKVGNYTPAATGVDLVGIDDNEVVVAFVQNGSVVAQVWGLTQTYATLVKTFSLGTGLDPSLAVNDRQALLTWDHPTAGIQGAYIAVPVMSTASIGAPFNVVGNATAPAQPAAVWDGSQYVVTWYEPNGSAKIAGARIGREGRFTAADSDRAIDGPSLAGGSSIGVVAYPIIDTSRASHRVVVRSLSYAATGAAATEAGHCLSGVLGDNGVCCAAECCGSCDASGACLPRVEICDNGVSDDCDTDIDCGDTDCQASPLCHEFNCADGQDSDNDGATDCADSDCAAALVCQPEDCGDNIDNNGNGLIDCADPGCTAAPCEPSGERTCNDLIDNDRDGLTDCADPNCSTAIVCRPEICNNFIDDNGNGKTDCFDPACAQHSYCQAETACTDGRDNDADGLKDCRDSDCDDDPACEETACFDRIDNDGDGLIDCADPDCQENNIFCEPTETTCNDNRDNDGDGFTDCRDPSCAAAENCLESLHCTDGWDNDWDGFMDCADPDCRGIFPCEPDVELNCGDGIDNDGDGVDDCDDCDCASFCTYTEESGQDCQDKIDNDCDGKTDCEDFSCTGEPCPDGGVCSYAAGKTECIDPCNSKEEEKTFELCTDKVDNDCNEQTDCADPNCWNVPCSEDGTMLCMCDKCIEECIPTMDEEDPEKDPDACKDGKDNDCDCLIDCEEESCRKGSDCG